MMKFFGGPVAWKANKQDIITMSSIEAKFLTLLQIAKEIIYMARLFRALKIELDESLTIEYNNHITIRLLVEETAKL